MPEDKGLLSDKKTAYEQSAFEKKQKEKMNTLPKPVSMATTQTSRTSGDIRPHR